MSKAKAHVFKESVTANPHLFSPKSIDINIPIIQMYGMNCLESIVMLFSKNVYLKKTQC